MPDFTPEQRADPVEAGAVLDTILGDSSTPVRRAFLEFLARSIEWAAYESNDRWGVTLHRRRLRLNMGWVECVVAFEDGINVLVEAASTPVEFHLNGREYKWAPGCDTVTLTVSAAAEALHALTECHRAAISIAARQAASPAIRGAHSPGILLWLSERIGRPLPHPSYKPEDGDAEIVFVEGARTSSVVSRYERDPRAREACLKEHGPTCVVCGMTFAKRYGPDTKDCIEVHHLAPLADIGKAHPVHLGKDLRPVCPNCHRVIHRGPNGLWSIEEAKALLDDAANKF